VKFIEIKDTDRVNPGEYILHTPSNKIVLCGSFNREKNLVRVLVDGKLQEDIIENFQKIHVNRHDRQKMSFSRCKGCSG
jgi:hypothetical protein